MTVPDLGSAPGSVHALVADLTTAGFVLVSDDGEGAVNRILQLAGPWCGVRITADRGQWWVDLGRPPQVGWYDPDLWRACLDDAPVSAEPLSFDEEADFVRRRWTEVAVAPPEVDACLSRTQSQRARERLGLPPVLG